MAKENWQQVKDIFVKVVRQKPEVRQQYLETACQSNNDLHREVESLLSSYDSAESFMELPAVVEVAGSFKAGVPQLECGRTLGHYEIIRQIGKGGMGEVYLAYDKTLDRKVAVKILYERFSRDESNLRRFIREAKAASGLNHPNILVIHEIGETDTTLYIVSEYVEGRTLREYTKEESLKLTEVLDVSIQIAGALTAAHTAHLVHRDIKPENIMIRPDGFVKVLDFGLAKLIEWEDMSPLDPEAETRQQHQTAKGVILGTVNYMSPEQAQGRETDERTDIWSLGVVMYELLSGKLPFEGKTTNHTIVSILENEPKQIEGIPNALQRIIRKTLTKEKKNRYQVARDLLIDLKSLKHELEVLGEIDRSITPYKEERIDTDEDGFETEYATRITNPSSLQYVLTGAKSHKPAVAVAGLLLLALISVGVYFAFFASVARQIDSVAVMPFVNDSGDQEDEYLSDGMTETLIHSLSKIPGLSVKARSSVFLYKGKEISPKKVGEELNVQVVLSGRVVQHGEDLALSLELVDAQTETILWSEKYDRKMSDLVSLQSEIAREVSESLKVNLTPAERERVVRMYTQNSEAQKLYLQGRFHWMTRHLAARRKTVDEFKKAIEYFEQAVKADPDYALAYSGLADVYQLMPLYSDSRAYEYMPLAKKAAQKALELDDDLAEAHASYGNVLWYYDYDWEGAEREFRRAIELDPGYATVREWYAELLGCKGMHDEAIREMERALALEPNSKFHNLMMGNTYYQARRYDEAIVQYQKTVGLFPEEPSLNAYVMQVYKHRGMYSEAYKYFLLANEGTGNDSEELRRQKEAYEKGGWNGLTRLRIEMSRQARKEKLEKDKTAYIRSLRVALEYAALKDKEKTLEYLNKAFEERDSFLVYLKVRPDLDFVKDEPRFRELVRKVGIPDS